MLPAPVSIFSRKHEAPRPVLVTLTDTHTGQCAYQYTTSEVPNVLTHERLHALGITITITQEAA